MQICLSPGRETENLFGVALSRDAPILPAKFLENYVGKSKEQNAGKIGGKLEKWAPRNGNLAHFV